MTRPLQTIVLAALLSTALAREAAAQYCPSYTPADEPSCKYEPVPGTNPTLAEWQGIFDLVSKGPSAWGTRGPSVPDIGQGCDNPTTKITVAARFPCELLKGIARQESGWKQFCVPTTPAAQVGQPSRTIVSFDCGYGVGQVTSGMRVQDPTPSFDPARVTSDATYNLATGTRILADKWRGTPCVGDNIPSIVEHWYTATWAYNGLSYKNNPTNPTYSGTRGVWVPTSGAAAPYQEKVWGWIEHPTNANYGTPVALAYPALGEIPAGMVGRPNALSEPTCATPTSCTQRRTSHTSACLGGGGGADAGVPDAGAADADGTDAGGDEGDAGAEGGGGDGCGCRIGRATSTSSTTTSRALLGLTMVLLLVFLQHKRIAARRAR